MRADASKSPPKPAGEVAQLVKLLPCEDEDLGFLIRNFVKCQTCVLRIPAPERQIHGLSSLPSLLDDLQVSERPCLKQTVWNDS